MTSTHGPALPEIHKRLRWVALVGIAAFALLVGRLWQLQVMRGESYYERTVSNVVKERYLPSARGDIVDHNGVWLATNRPAFNIYITPKSLTPEVKAELERMLGLSDDEIAKIDERLAVGKRRAIRRAPWSCSKIKAAIVRRWSSRRARVLPGIEVRYEQYRYYPHGELAASLVGYMTQMTADEADRLGAQGYDTSELVGRSGLELAWENYLRGKKGVERFAVDARGQRLDEQTAAALIEGDQRDPIRLPGAKARAHARCGSPAAPGRGRRVAHTSAAALLVVVEPKTGKIRAIVSKPSFDPMVMTGQLTLAEYTLLMRDPRKPLIE